MYIVFFIGGLLVGWISKSPFTRRARKIMDIKYAQAEMFYEHAAEMHKEILESMRSKDYKGMAEKAVEIVNNNTNDYDAIEQVVEFLKQSYDEEE